MAIMGMDLKSRNQITNIFFGFVLGCLFLSMLSPKAPEPRTSNIFLPVATRIEDDVFLGPKEDKPPARRSGYVYASNSYQQLYDKTWTQGGYPRQSCWGCRFAADVMARINFHSVLDAGTGNGAMIRLLRSHGKSAWGIELSKAVLQTECPDLLATGHVEPGVLTNLPYEDNQFDLVFSADVLEHVHPDEVDAVVRELVRVSRRHLFLSISLKGHTRATAANSDEAHRHTMLRPRKWWEAKFAEYGAIPNRELIWAMQEKDGHYTREEMRRCQWEGSRDDGGLYEVCVVPNKWLVGRREQENLRRDRCMTAQNNELEPWFFAFRKLR